MYFCFCDYRLNWAQGQGLLNKCCLISLRTLMKYGKFVSWEEIAVLQKVMRWNALSPWRRR